MIDAIGAHDDGDLVEVRSKTTGTWRHGAEHELVAHRKSDDTYWRLQYSTTPEDGICRDRMDMSVVRVYKHERVVTTYESKP